MNTFPHLRKFETYANQMILKTLYKFQFWFFGEKLSYNLPLNTGCLKEYT